jgi:peroxiredoxin
MKSLAGKLFAVPALFAILLALSSLAFAASPADGTWIGTATFRGQEVPVRLEIAGASSSLHAAFVNGAERSAASSASLEGGHLLLNFNYYARTLDGTLTGDQFIGTFGLTSNAPHATPRVPVTLHRAVSAPPKLATGPDIHGDWEIAVSGGKGESAWQLRVEPASSKASPAALRAVIQRIDGDTGSLYGGWDGHQYILSHFTAAGPALYSIVPQADGTLRLSNLIASDAQKAYSTDLVGRRPSDARKQNLAPPTDSTQATRMKDSSRPFPFRFPDLAGNIVANTDPRFRGKVVIVAIGGSWCPNCHDEAPFLESLYKQFHSKGLEIVNLSFEEDDQLKNPTRLRAFIQRYSITYPVLIAGTPDQLNEKITVADNLNSWPTSFILGRNGRVREIHAGFAGPANPQGHQALEREVTTTIEKLLAEPTPVQKASR